MYLCFFLSAKQNLPVAIVATEKDKDVKKKANLKRPRKSVSEPYDQYSKVPPTKAQCEDSGSFVWNAVAAFYSSQPPPLSARCHISSRFSADLSLLGY